MRDRLRFCMITTFYPPYSMGGDAVNVYRQAALLARQGHEVDVIHCADSYHALTKTPPGDASGHPEGITVHTLRSGVGALSPLATQQTGQPAFKRRQIQAILDSKPFDVIHFHNVSLIGGPGLLRMGSAIKLYTTHEHWLVCPTHVLFKFNREACETPSCLRCVLAHRRPPQLWRYTGRIRRELRHIDMLIAPSEFTLRRHQAAGLDVPMTRLPFFVDATPGPSGGPELETGGTPALRAAWSRPYFLFAGRLEKLKGLQTLFPVFRKYAEADLLVAGDGEYAPELRSMAHGCERVRFLGRLPADRLRTLYEGAIALIVPSITHETFGSVVVEAFAAGTPAIVRDLGALPELVDQSGAGFIYRSEPELIGAMRGLQSEPALRVKLSNLASAAYARRWTPEVFLDGYLSIVREIHERSSNPLRSECTAKGGQALHERADVLAADPYSTRAGRAE